MLKHIVFTSFLFLSALSVASQAELSERDFPPAYALFNYLVPNNTSYQGANAEVYFLEVYQADPPQKFMGLFKNSSTIVKPASAAKIDRANPVKPNVIVSDLRTGKAGIVLKIHQIKWVDESRALIKAGYYEGFKSGGVDLFTLELTNNKWSVVSKQAVSVS